MQIQIFETIGNDVRCSNCGTLLAKKSGFTVGNIEIKCHKCNNLNKIKFAIVEESVV